MAVPRCTLCGRVLNSDSSCVNELECSNHLLFLIGYCTQCGHPHNPYAGKEDAPKQKKPKKKNNNSKAS